MKSHTSLPYGFRPVRILPFLALLSFSAVTQQARADDEVVITENARAHFRAGVNFLQDPDGARHAEAYREFRAAYDESPSWKILGNLGITAMKLERDGEAIEAFETYLREAGDRLDPSERAQVTRDLETLKAGVTWVTLSSTPAGASVVDTRFPLAGAAIDNRYGTLSGPLRIGVRAGRHKISVDLEGHLPKSWSFEAKGGELEQSFELEPQAAAPSAMSRDDSQPTTERPTPTSVYVGLVATGAFTAGATVTGILALGKKSEFNEAASSGEASSAKSSGETLNLTTDILIGAAVVSAATTAVLYFTRPEVTADPKLDTGLRIAPTVMSGGGGFWMFGSF